MNELQIRILSNIFKTIKDYNKSMKFIVIAVISSIVIGKLRLISFDGRNQRYFYVVLFTGSKSVSETFTFQNLNRNF